MSGDRSGLGPIRWQDYTHEHMYRMLMAADPEAVFQEAEKAAQIADHMGTITTAAHAIAQDVTSAWSGPAASRAAASISSFLTWADETANTANSVASLLSQYAHVLNRARLSMPSPPSGAHVPLAQADAVKTHAVQVMEHYATESDAIYVELGRRQFPAPPKGTGLPLPAPEPGRPPLPGSPRVPAGTTSLSGWEGTSAPSGMNATPPIGDAGVNGAMGGLGALGPPVGGTASGSGGANAVGGMAVEGALAGTAAAGATQPMEAGLTPTALGQAKGAPDEHQRPSYLIEPDPNELFGITEKIAPPVIGEET